MLEEQLSFNLKFKTIPQALASMVIGQAIAWAMLYFSGRLLDRFPSLVLTLDSATLVFFILFYYRFPVNVTVDSENRLGDFIIVSLPVVASFILLPTTQRVVAHLRATLGVMMADHLPIFGLRLWKMMMPSPSKIKTTREMYEAYQAPGCPKMDKSEKESDEIVSEDNSKQIDIAVSDDKQNISDTCQETFTPELGIITYRDTIHNEQKDYACDQCEKKFLKKSSLFTHQKLKHKNCNKDFTCNNYFVNWYKYPPTARLMLVLFITANMGTLQLKAGSLFIMNLDTCSNINMCIKIMQEIYKSIRRMWNVLKIQGSSGAAVCFHRAN
ncbi:unnamed protein product [Trichogramma brassicae]|uniref:C2H2-type domain-containing protein n=1 Tax=Trichogramma brassicae TaxID=86971 RepID=A0A6H5IP59_9HYME|nr:unnamed protein product [Trichogramma brassicae]